MKKILVYTYHSFKKYRSEWISLLCSTICIFILLLLGTGFEEAGFSKFDGSLRLKAVVEEVDDTNIKATGLVHFGEQSCKVRLLEGEHRGEIYSAMNILTGSMEKDKIYKQNEKSLVLVSTNGGEVSAVSMIDHYRVDYEFFLLMAFFAVLVLFAGWTGVRAIISFILSLLMIWKILIPCFLKGYSPILVGASVTLLLTLFIISLVFGFDKRCLAAVSGAGGGIILTALLGIWSTKHLKIQGAVMAFSESLLYSGFENLDLTKIFMASIFIGASGAMMDLCVDISAAVYEVCQKRPDLSAKEAIFSGMRVGRAAMGTMTTTLLLAYSGGYISLLMVFMAQGTPLINILSYKYVSSEIIHTIVGSFGLVLAAPITAVASGMLLSHPQDK